MNLNENPILVALDGMSPEEAYGIAETLKGLVGGFKVNNLLDAAGHENAIKIRELKKYGKVVMADPKLHNIPNTVANRMEEYAKIEADLVTVMASGGVEMIIAAIGSAGKVFQAKRPNIIRRFE